MSARPCRTGCGHDAEGRSDLCSAHRKRAQRNGGDPLAHIPVRRRPRAHGPAAVTPRHAEQLAVYHAVLREQGVMPV